MSYYDHASSMAHRLGPWADDLAIDRPAARSPRGLYADRLPNPSRGSMPGRLCAGIRARLRIRPKPAAGTDGDAPPKT